MRTKLQFPEEGQLALLPAPGPRLTARQAHVLELLHTAGHDGLDADQAGAHLCALKGIHTADTRCQWDARGGRQVLEALAAKGLARYRRANRARSLPGAWLATNLTADTEAARDDFGEFPEGF